MSILKVARMGHPVLRTRPRARESRSDEVRALPEADRRHDRDDGRIRRHRPGGPAGPRRPSGCSSARHREACRRATSGRPVRQPGITPVGTRRARGLGRLPEHPRHARAACRAPRHSVSGPSIATASPFEMRLKNFPARVVQHETDHLDGVLFLDRMASLAVARVPRRVPALRQPARGLARRPRRFQTAAR